MFTVKYHMIKSDQLKEIATAWVEMWLLEINDPMRSKYDWVDDFEYKAVYESPNLAIDLILEILKLGLSEKTKEVLAAGPLEQVLANHGDAIIERVELLARRDPQFSSLLGGVWQNNMSDEVWMRVKNASNRSGWDGNA